MVLLEICPYAFYLVTQKNYCGNFGNLDFQEMLEVLLNIGEQSLVDQHNQKNLRN